MLIVTVVLFESQCIFSGNYVVVDCEVVTQIKTGLVALDLPAAVILTFPFDEILIAALATSWKTLALRWIVQGYPFNDEMRLLLCDNDKQNPYWLKAQKERLKDVLNI